VKSNQLQFQKLLKKHL